MIIVSQDRETVVNFENIIRIRVCKYNGENYIQCDFPYGNYQELGEYKTEERAKEVLQEIIVAINEKSQIEMTGEGMTTTVSSPFYEMPEE